MKSLFLAGATALALAAAPAVAAPIYAPVPTANYIVVGNLDWAWASPCNITGGCSSIDLSYQSGQGWRIPTLAEFLARPDYTAFGSKCASAWFDVQYSHCDFGDAANGYIADFGYGVLPLGSNYYSETWLVRSVGGAVPEPATWALMILGFGAVGATMRRKRVNTSVRFA